MVDGAGSANRRVAVDAEVGRIPRRSGPSSMRKQSRSGMETQVINRAAKSRGKSESDTTCNTPVATGNRRGVSNAARDTETVAAADREPCHWIRFHDSEFRVLTSSLVTRRGLLIPGRTLPRRAHATPLPRYKVRFHIANTPTSIQPRHSCFRVLFVSSYFFFLSCNLLQCVLDLALLYSHQKVKMVIVGDWTFGNAPGG